MHIKKIAALLTALMMVVAVTACSGGADSPVPVADDPPPAVDDNVEVTAPDTVAEESPADPEPTGDGPVINFWNGFTGSDGEILTEIVDRYNAENDKGITIKMDIIPWANFHEQLPTALATNTAPQMVLSGAGGDIANYTNQNAFIPMDDFFELTGNDRSNFTEASLEMFTVDGTLYGIPMQIIGQYLYWNKDHFAEVGLDPESPPQTWEELGEYAIQLTDPEKNRYGFGVATGFMNMEHLIMCSGITPIDDVNMKSNLDSEVVVEAYRFMQNLTYNEKVSPPSTPGADMDNLVFAQTVSMFINGPWMNNGLQRNEVNYGVTVIPAGSAGRHGTLGGNHFGVTRGVSDEDKLAAYDFINHWNSTEICKEWSMRNGFPPYLQSVADDPEVASDPIVSELYKALEYVVPVNQGITVMTRIEDDVYNPITEEILYGGADPADKVPEMAAAVDMLLGSQ